MRSFIPLTILAKSILMKKILQNVKKKFKKDNEIQEQKLLMEYLFVDINRLESYISQIKGAVKYDKIPTLAAGISTTGPKLIYTRTKVPLKWTYHEMIIELLDYLEKSNKMLKGRPSKQEENISFCLETCVVRKLIPQEEKQAFTLWISMSPEEKSNEIHETPWKAGPLCLIESYSEIDDQTETLSGFSYLTDIVMDYAKRFPPPETWSSDDTSWFAMESFETFLKNNFRVSAPHHVKCLYLIRATISYENEKLVTFGYPIFISESL